VFAISCVLLIALFRKVMACVLSVRFRFLLWANSVFMAYSARFCVPQISPLFINVDSMMSTSSCLHSKVCHMGAAFVKVEFSFSTCSLLRSPMINLTRSCHFFIHLAVQTVKNASSSECSLSENFSIFSSKFKLYAVLLLNFM